MCSVANCVPVKTITLQQMPKGTGGREALGIEGLGTGPSAAPATSPMICASSTEKHMQPGFNS